MESNEEPNFLELDDAEQVALIDQTDNGPKPEDDVEDPPQDADWVPEGGYVA